MDFYKASDAREASVGQRIVTEEIQKIELEVLTAIEAGKLSTLVGPGSDTPVTTLMTASSDYYGSWSDVASNNTDADKLRRARMDQVISHFGSLGYSVTRVQQASGSTWNWSLKW